MTTKMMNTSWGCGRATCWNETYFDLFAIVKICEELRFNWLTFEHCVPRIVLFFGHLW